MAFETHHELGSLLHRCKVPNYWLQVTQRESWPFNSSQLWITYVSLNRFSKAKAREKLALIDLEVEL